MKQTSLCSSHTSEPEKKHSVDEYSLHFYMLKKRLLSLCEAVYEKNVNSKWKAAMLGTCGSLSLCLLIVHEIDTGEENSDKISPWNIKTLFISVGHGLWHLAME